MKITSLGSAKIGANRENLKNFNSQNFSHNGGGDTAPFGRHMADTQTLDNGT